jgi:hypothetical protein
LWRLTGGLDVEAAGDLVSWRLDPLSLLDYDGAASTLHMHEVFRSYLAATLADKAGLHTALAASWGDRPPARQRHAWRWLVFHRAAAIAAMAPAQRHDPAQRLVALVGDVDWQARHEAVLADLPALREALASALDAAVAVDPPGAAALIVEAADALLRFDREHANVAPVFELARHGDLEGARRRSDLFVWSVDAHWHQALLLVVGWLAPLHRREAARALVAEVQRNLGPEAPLHDLLAWVRADLYGDVPPAFVPSIPAGAASEALIEQLLKRRSLPYAALPAPAKPQRSRSFTPESLLPARITYSWCRRRKRWKLCGAKSHKHRCKQSKRSYSVRRTEHGCKMRL